MSLRDAIERIRIQKLFLLVVTIKLACSFLAWRLNSPWILGFTIPLVAMGAYIVIGLLRSKNDVSDERFGDSCYYLGFIFTISSIAFSLFDIPDLNKEGKLTEVAVRFGAAMVSTFLGFVVRVYLVGFRSDSGAAMQSLEDQIIASARALQTRLDLSREAFETFADKTQQATSTAETRIQLAVEKVGKHLTKEMADALRALATDVQRVHATAAAETQQTTKQILQGLGEISAALGKDVQRTEQLFTGLEERLFARLNAVVFPEDLFMKQVAPAVRALVETVSTLGSDLTNLRTTVQQSSRSLTNAMAKVEAGMKVPQSVGELVEKQETLGREMLQSMSTTTRALETSATAIREQGAALGKMVEQLGAANTRQEQVTTGIAQVVQGLATLQTSQKQLADGIQRVVTRLEQLPRPTVTAPPVITLGALGSPTAAPLPATGSISSAPVPPPPRPQPAPPAPRSAISPEPPRPPANPPEPKEAPRGNFLSRLFGRNKE